MSDLSATDIALLAGAVVAVLAGFFAGVTQVITAIRSTTKSTNEAVIASAEASQKRGVVRDIKLQEIHLLVNSRLVTVLRLLVANTKKEAERTGEQADIRAYEEALRHLDQAEASAKSEAKFSAEAQRINEADAASAEVKLVEVLEKTKGAIP